MSRAVFAQSAGRPVSLPGLWLRPDAVASAGVPAVERAGVPAVELAGVQAVVLAGAQGGSYSAFTFPRIKGRLRA